MPNEMTPAPELIGSINETAHKLFEVLATCNEENFNKIPFPGSWSPAQVTDHISKTLSAMSLALYGETKPADRDPAQFVKPLEQVMLNFDTKFNAPESLLPNDEPHEKETLISKLKHNFDKINAAAVKLPLDETCVSFEFPQLGHLTRLEVLRFAALHTQRHIHQLENVCRLVEEGI